MRRAAWVVAVALLGAGCDEKKTTSETARVEAGTDKYATADPKLTKALQAAAAEAGSDKGPPAGGFFAPGAADERHPKGKPTGIEVVSDGADPKVALGAPDALKPAYGTAALRIGEQQGRSAKPTVDYVFAVGPAKKDEGGTDWLVYEIKKAAPAPSSQQPGQLPPGMDKEIATLQGTQLRLKSTPDGRVSDIQVQLGKATRPDLEVFAESAAQDLALSTVPLPERPVGVGAQWIAESRMLLNGVDVIAYRAFQVKTITDNRVHLSVDVKSYVTSSEATLQGLPKGATLMQFDGEAQCEMEIVRGEAVARVSDIQQRMMMVFQAPGASPPEGMPERKGEGPPMGVIPVQMQGQATLARGEDLRAASKN
jgi:hypothetical protein